ncbi:hypothetical protein AHAS_Ahas19G0193300 [Arachis hypogaea]
MLAYKYWKAAPNLKEYEYSKSEEGVKPLYHTRKIGYRFEISQHNTLFKRRKFFDRGSVLTSDGGFSNDSVSNLPEKGMDRASHIASSKLHELIVYTLYAVKFSIKSFKIPELYIDVLKTETIGSLKRTVMEAVMTLFGSGMLVGALVQGKKVRDDNRTLLQMCLCSKEKLNKLGITLEPNSIQDSPADCLDDPSHYETSHPIRVLVVVPPRSPETLATDLVSQTTKRPKLIQYRTRRPFSVSEVEALVEVVKELGIGRWRDVKLRAFENADHRTYVDLKSNSKDRGKKDWHLEKANAMIDTINSALKLVFH